VEPSPAILGCLWFGILAGSTIAFQAVYAARLGASGFQIGLLNSWSSGGHLIFTLPSGRWMEGKSLIKVSYRFCHLATFG